jgi:hypothetical protein
MTPQSSTPTMIKSNTMTTMISSQQYLTSIKWVHLNFNQSLRLTTPTAMLTLTMTLTTATLTKTAAMMMTITAAMMMTIVLEMTMRALRPSKRKNRGKMDRFSNYGLFMAARQQARAGLQ